MASKLAEMRALESGWWGENSFAVPEQSLNLLESALDYIASRSTYVAFSADTSGSIVLEWECGVFECMVILDGSSRMTLVSEQSGDDRPSERVVEANGEELKRFIGEMTE